MLSDITFPTSEEYRTGTADEPAKFDIPLSAIRTNLEKLVYTMKTLDKTPFAEYPDFWDEEWLRRAINELNTRNMTPEERYQFARVTAKNAEAIYAEKQRIQDAKEETQRIVVINLIQETDFDTARIATIARVSVEFVEQVRQKMNENS